MIPLRCAYCNNLIGNMWARQVWEGGQVYCPSCLKVVQQQAKDKLNHHVCAKTFTIGSINYLRCPVCQSAAVLNLELNQGRCRCGQMLMPLSRSTFEKGTADPNTKAKANNYLIQADRAAKMMPHLEPSRNTTPVDKVTQVLGNTRLTGTFDELYDRLKVGMMFFIGDYGPMTITEILPKHEPFPIRFNRKMSSDPSRDDGYSLGARVTIPDAGWRPNQVAIGGQATPGSKGTARELAPFLRVGSKIRIPCGDIQTVTEIDNAHPNPVRVGIGGWGPSTIEVVQY